MERGCGRGGRLQFNKLGGTAGVQGPTTRLVDGRHGRGRILLLAEHPSEVPRHRPGILRRSPVNSPPPSLLSTPSIRTRRWTVTKTIYTTYCDTTTWEHHCDGGRDAARQRRAADWRGVETGNNGGVQGPSPLLPPPPRMERRSSEWNAATTTFYNAILSVLFSGKGTGCLYVWRGNENKLYAVICTWCGANKNKKCLKKQ